MMCPALAIQLPQVERGVKAAVPWMRFGVLAAAGTARINKLIRKMIGACM